MRPPLRLLALALVVTSPALACWGDLANQRLTEIRPEEEDSSSSLGDLSAGATDGTSTSTSSVTSTSAGTGPSGSDSSADTSTSSDPTTTTDPAPVDPPPSIDAFHVSATSFSEPGPLTVTLAHSDDVVEIEIYRGDALLRALPPDSPTATEVVIPILNHPDLAGTADVIAVVRDELGQEDARSEPVTVELPPAGTVVWHAQWTDDTYAEGLAVAAIDGLTVTAGYRVPPNPAVRPTMKGWTDDGDESWSLNVVHAPPQAMITALAEGRGAGEFAVAGTIITPYNPLGNRPWVRMYTGAGPSTMVLAEGVAWQSARVFGAAVLPSGRAPAVVTSTKKVSVRAWPARQVPTTPGGVGRVTKCENFDVDSGPRPSGNRVDASMRSTTASSGVTS